MPPEAPMITGVVLVVVQLAFLLTSVVETLCTWLSRAYVVPAPTAAVPMAAGVVEDSTVDHAAAVVLDATITCPAVGAVFVDVATIVVAVRIPDAVLSSDNLESFPWQIVLAVVP